MTIDLPPIIAIIGLSLVAAALTNYLVKGKVIHTATVLRLIAVVLGGTLAAYLLSLLFGVHGGPNQRGSIWIGLYWWPMLIALFYTFFRMGSKS